MVKRHIDRAAAVHEKEMATALNVNAFHEPVWADVPEDEAPESTASFEESALATTEDDCANEVGRGIDVHIGDRMPRFIAIPRSKLQMVGWVPRDRDDTLVRDAVRAAIKGTHRHNRFHHIEGASRSSGSGRSRRGWRQMNEGMHHGSEGKRRTLE